MEGLCFSHAGECNPSIDFHHFSLLHHFLRSLDFHRFSGGGGSCRRQGKSAAPDGPAWWMWLVGLGVYRQLFDERDDQGEGAGDPTSPAPGPPGPLLRYLSSEMGGPGGGALGGWGPGGEDLAKRRSMAETHLWRLWERQPFLWFRRGIS